MSKTQSTSPKKVVMKIEKAPYLHFHPLRSSFSAQLGGQATARSLGSLACWMWYFRHQLHCFSDYKKEEQMEVK